MADSEPPRVRAILGAIGEQIGKKTAVTQRLRASLNPFSKFDFGLLAGLPAREPLAGQGTVAEMKLYEHPDFEQAILRAAEHFRGAACAPQSSRRTTTSQRHLRIITATAGDKVIFKGGTSLSKGWNLIQRFSEDIDIFLDPIAFEPPWAKNGNRSRLKKLRDAIEAHPALTFVEKESQTIGGFGRNDRFSYAQRFGGPGEVPNRVFVEAGTASGRQPAEASTCARTLGNSCRKRGLAGRRGRRPVSMRLLHFRRTFVEKMFAIHAKVEAIKQDGQPLGSYARHYYDLFCLAAPEVVAMLSSGSTPTSRPTMTASAAHIFREAIFCPDDMSFAKSDALFPPLELAATIKAEYDRQCTCGPVNVLWTLKCIMSPPKSPGRVIPKMAFMFAPST